MGPMGLMGPMKIQPSGTDGAALQQSILDTTYLILDRSPKIACAIIRDQNTISCTIKPLFAQS